jgi:hypothetical protein
LSVQYLFNIKKCRPVRCARRVILKKICSKLKNENFLENLGESELREALLRKSEYLATIGDKTGAIEVQETSRFLVQDLAVFRICDVYIRIRILGSVHWIMDPDPICYYVCHEINTVLFKLSAVKSTYLNVKKNVI